MEGVGGFDYHDHKDSYFFPDGITIFYLIFNFNSFFIILTFHAFANNAAPRKHALE